jgi:Protein of unknown function (DUF1573)
MKVLTLVGRCTKSTKAAEWPELWQLVQLVARPCFLLLLKNRHLDYDRANDLLQELYVHIQADNFRRLKMFRGTTRRELRGFLRAIARHRAIDLLRRSATWSHGSSISFDLSVPAENICPGPAAHPKKGCVVGSSSRLASFRPGHHGGGIRWALLAITIGVSGCNEAISRADQLALKQKVSARAVPHAIVTSTLLIAPGDQLSFGVVRRGSSATISFSLRNPRSSPVSVTAIETSCDCFQVRLAKNTVGPGEEVVGSATVDFSKDAKFSGGLLVQATGFADGGQRAFVLRSSVDVN